MKKLVAYYSFEGNTKFFAETIAKEIKADLLELKPIKEIKTKGFLKFPVGGFQVVFGIKPKLQPFDINPQDYDVIFLGTPAWSLTYSPTMRSFLSKEKFENKKVVLFCSRMTQKGRTFKAMKKKLKGNDIVDEFDLNEPLKNEKDEKEKMIKTWVKGLNKKLK
ncbi:MAG: flavodoxin [Asgard group archaeon]|nr:flavodoxin [Asgard group archaeon]